jgi:intergrase/recombinase
MTLNHWKFRQFLRTTKKVFISYITPEMLQGVTNIGKGFTYNAIRYTCQRKGVSMDMRFCRKIHASWLHKYGIPEIIIDSLQGRVPASIFAKSYYRPSLDYRDKTLAVLHKLKDEMV